MLENKNKMGEKALLVTFVTLIFLSLIYTASATNTYIYAQNQPIDLKVPCFNNGTYCSGTATCNLTVQFPNGSLLVDNQEMTNSGSYHNYTIPSASTGLIGKYYSSMICTDIGVNGYSTFDFQITGDGSEQTTGKSLLFGILLFISLVFCIGAFAYGLSNEKPFPIIVGVMLGILFMIMTYQTMMLIPEIQGQINLYDSVVTIYDIVLWAFFIIFMFFIFFMIYKAFKFAEDPNKAKMRKWGLLMDDE